MMLSAPLFPVFRISARLQPLLVSAMLLGVAGCGGGGGGEADAPEPERRTSLVSPACEGCGAVSANEYSGPGLGVWIHRNAGAVDMDVPVYITGVAGRGVSLVFTRDSQMGAAEVAPAAALGGLRAHGLSSSPRALTAAPVAAPGPGDLRIWRHNDDSDRATRLAGYRLAADGTRVNVWVEEGQAGNAKVSDAVVESLLSAYASPGAIHDSLTALGGPLWGTHVFTGGMLPGGPWPLDIVLLDFKVSGKQPKAYFWGRNNYLRAVVPDSNEALAVFLDAPGTYTTARGLIWARSNLAHEMLHLQNFYRRNVLTEGRDIYPDWLEEMTAMVFEDIVAGRLGDGYNSLRDGRLPAYLAGNDNCPWLDFGATTACDSYATTGLFGAFLLRQFGVSWFVDVLHRSGSDGIKVVEAAMRAVNPKGDFASAFRRFAVSASALVVSATAPADYGFPARTDSAWAVSPIEPRDMARYQVIPAALPSVIGAFGSSVLKRQPIQGVYSDLVRVPAGVTLSVVVE